ncbi:MAG TPA: hypothetical protein VFY93_13265 [Planctomycetota bacterium]|nr:hypothetical protein [Planctomycetota bacterium]
MRYARIALGSLLVVAAAGAGVYYATRERAPAPGAPPPPHVAEERHYYVFLTLVEVEPGKWDVDGSPPDLFYRIRWQGHDVFRSAKKKDTLVAKWSTASLGLGDVVKSVSIDDSIKAARITARAGDTIEFAVFDADVGFDDPAGSWTVGVDDLALGDQAWHRPGGKVVAAECRVLPIEDVGFASLTR